MNPHRKHLLRHRFYCCVCVLRALFRNGSTLVGCIFVAGLFTESFPSNGSICHIKKDFKSEDLSKEIQSCVVSLLQASVDMINYS
jgi:hypothetical protein